MIFFRAHDIAFKFQRKDKKQVLFFGKLKAFYSAPVNELSGMVVNLKDVDQWMEQAISEAPAFKNSEDALQFYFQNLKKSSKALQKIQIRVGSRTFEFDGKTVLRSYDLHSWFQESGIEVRRFVCIQTEKSLSKNWREKVAHKRWSSVDVFAKHLESHLPGLKSLEIQFPETVSFRRFRY